MARFWGIWLLTIGIAAAQAQQASLDSIKLLIKEEGYQMSSDSLFLIAKKGQGIALSLENDSEEALMLLNQGFARMDQERWDEADSLFLLAKETAEQAQDSLLTARAHINLGAIAFQQSAEDDAIVHYTEAARLFNLIHKPNASVLNNLAIVYKKQEKYDKAIALYEQSIVIKTSNADTLGVANSYMNLALLYSKLNLDTQALDAARQAIALYQKLDLENYIAWAEFALGNIFFDLERLGESRLHFQNALAYYRQHKDESYYYLTLYAFGKLAYEQKAWNEAEEYYREALTLAREKEQTENIHLIARSLSQVLLEQGKETEAYQLLDESMALKDTLVKESRLALMEEMQARFELGQKDNKLRIQQLEIERRTLNQRTAWIAAGSIAFLLFLLLFFFYQKSKTNRLLNKKNTIIATQLKEKESLMREMHHRVKNNLQFISSLLQLQSMYIRHDKAREALESSQNMVTSISLIHQHLYQGEKLSSIKLDEYLKRLVQELHAAFSPPACDIDLEYDFAPFELDIEEAVPIGLIVNELMLNALKYAFTDRQSGKLLVQLVEKEEQLQVIVEDDGPGLGAPSSPDEGFGSKLINLLTKQLGGSIKVLQEKGMRVSIVIPKAKLRL